MEQMEYFLAQSANGIHFLFDHESIVEILKRPTVDKEFFTLENVCRIQDILEELLEHRGFFDKLNYMRLLSKQDYELLVRSYFNIVENSIFETELKH